MFKQSRRKIVAAIMSILVVIWLMALGAIYLFSYHEVTEQNREMLQEHISQYRLNISYLLEENNSGKTNEIPHFPDMSSQKNPYFREIPAFKLSTFYSVALSYDGTVLEIRNHDAGVYTDEQLEELALQLLEGTKNSGIEENLLFSIVDKGGYILVGFMDNTIMQEGMMTLFRYTLMIGAIVIVALYFVARYLAKKIVEPLEENYQKQRQFVSDAGHELKTPVAIVNTNAELLYREIGENPWLANIQYESERMGKLIRQLLELARTENIKPEMEKIDFGHLVKGEVLPFESMAFEHHLMLHFEVAEKIYTYGNSTQLKQLTAILTDNAIRHGIGGKEVLFVVSKEKNMAKLSVINEGREIPEDEREKIFERFYRMDDVRNSKENHYGIGLAIAKAIVSSHKGKIKVLCYQGKVEFQVYLPLLKN